MSRTIRIYKGANIRLKGRPAAHLDDAPKTAVYAVKPPDFYGVTPKLVVREGDAVEAGSPLFYNKDYPSVQYLSPVSGKVKAVVRGAKRRILAVEVEADSHGTTRSFGICDPQKADRTTILSAMLEGGMFAFVEQRPFAVSANPADLPRSIHISGFASAPLAPDMGVVMKGRLGAFQLGVDALVKLAGAGGVHLGVYQGDAQFDGVENVEINVFNGPHPSGNVGVQIHHVAPISKGEIIWTMHPEDVANLGDFLSTGNYQPVRIVAAGGAGHPSPQYFKTLAGSGMEALLSGLVVTDGIRVVSGDALTGDHVSANGYLGSMHHQVTVLPEGNTPKFLLTDGWLAPGFSKFSLSRSFPTWLLPKSKEFDLDTNSNGEERAFVVTGQYEPVFPFEIYPVQLIKSIIANDIDGMEKLGIYEVAPEDFALCEYACTSKIAVQQIVRDGLDMLKKELG